MARSVGPKPKPTRLHLLENTFRGDRHSKTEPTPEPCIPDPPDCLCPVAAGEWLRLTPELARIGLLSEIDRNMLARYCQHYAYWHQAVMRLRTGLTQETKQGNLIQSIDLGIANRASDIMSKLESEFGMTPSSRARMGVSSKRAKSKFHGLISEED